MFYLYWTCENIAHLCLFHQESRIHLSEFFAEREKVNKQETER